MERGTHVVYRPDPLAHGVLKVIDVRDGHVVCGPAHPNAPAWRGIDVFRPEELAVFTVELVDLVGGEE